MSSKGAFRANVQRRGSSENSVEGNCESRLLRRRRRRRWRAWRCVGWLFCPRKSGIEQFSVPLRLFEQIDSKGSDILAAGSNQRGLVAVTRPLLALRRVCVGLLRDLRHGRTNEIRCRAETAETTRVRTCNRLLMSASTPLSCSKLDQLVSPAFSHRLAPI